MLLTDPINYRSGRKNSNGSAISQEQINIEFHSRNLDDKTYVEMKGE